MTGPRSDHVTVLAERAHHRIAAVTNPGDETGAVAALTVAAQTLASYAPLIRDMSAHGDAYACGIADGCERMAEVFAATADMFTIVDAEASDVLSLTNRKDR